MLCFRSRNSSPSVLFLTLFLFASSTLAVAKLHVVRHVDQEVLNEKEHGGLLSLEKRRSLVEEAPVDNSSLILAAERTYRKDFFNDLKYYSGGWNISNSHYWTSVFSTGIPFFGFAVAWFVFFGLCLCFICLHHCCCLREPYGYSRIAYAISLIFLIIFTIAAIAGCIVLYTGQGKFHSSTTNTLNYVVHQANITAEKLEDVSGYLDALKGISGGSVILPPKDIDSIELKINFAATLLSSQAGKNSENIKHVLDEVRHSLIILAAIMLFLSFLGFLFSIVGMQCLVYFLVIIGWILVTGTFILCGVFLLLHNVVADTCIAMDEWVVNPTAHTALDDILPCVDNATAHETLLKTKQVTYGLVNGVNGIIGGVSNLNVPPNAGPQVYYNQSGPLMPLLCNPFNSDLTDRKCAAGEVHLSNASHVFKTYTCEVSASGICTTPGRITPTVYNNIKSAVFVSYGLNQYGPFLIDLQDCTFVRDTFTDISRGYCPGLRRYTQWIYIGLLLVSAAVMLSLIFWVIYARERRHRVYAKQLMNLSS